MIYLQLFIEFFKTGLFALGGGLATIPFLYDMIAHFHWFTNADLMNMIAVSESTPGPIGVNMATYVGYITTQSFWGSLITTIGLVTPSVIVICIVANFLKKFKESHWVKDAFYGLRPAVTAMIAMAGLSVYVTTILPEGEPFAWIHFLLIAIAIGITFRFKKIHPIALICICALIGIIFQL